MLSGGTGFIGSHLLKELEKKYKIFLVVRRKKKIQRKNIVLINIKDLKKNRNKKFYAFIHLATYYKNKNNILEFKKYVDSNILLGIEILEIINLKKLEKKPCKAFSSGEKQLLLLGSSILHDANITIFDELTANLDITRLKEVFDIFNSDFLKQKIVITHNLDLAYALKFKVLYMRDGKIEFFGKHEEFFCNENLKKFYNDSISKVNEHLVVNL